MKPKSLYFKIYQESHVITNGSAMTLNSFYLSQKYGFAFMCRENIPVNIIPQFPIDQVLEHFTSE